MGGLLLYSCPEVYLFFYLGLVCQFVAFIQLKIIVLNKMLINFKLSFWVKVPNNCDLSAPTTHKLDSDILNYEPNKRGSGYKCIVLKGCLFCANVGSMT